MQAVKGGLTPISKPSILRIKSVEKYGVFKTQGYRNQLEMINYSVSPQFQFYDFNLEGDKLVLKSKDEKTELKLSKIDQFLQ